MMLFKDNTFAFTDGSGLWSAVSARVRLTRVEVPYIDKDSRFEGVRVYFDTNTWDVEQQGLIYTDEFFLTGLRNRMVMHLGFSRAAADDVEYSEQGMQGETFVSLDAGETFIAEWLAKEHVQEA